MNDRDVESMKYDIAIAAGAAWDAAEAQEKMLAIARRQEEEGREEQRRREAARLLERQQQTAGYISSLAQQLPREIAAAKDDPDTLSLLLAREAHYFGTFTWENWLGYDAQFPHLIETAYDQIQRVLAPVLADTWRNRSTYPASMVPVLKSLANTFAFPDMATMRAVRQAEADFDSRHRDQYTLMETMKNDIARLSAKITAVKTSWRDKLKLFWHGHGHIQPLYQEQQRVANLLSQRAADISKHREQCTIDFIDSRMDNRLRPILRNLPDTDESPNQSEPVASISTTTVSPSPPGVSTPITIQVSPLEAGLECLKHSKFDEAITLLTKAIQLDGHKTQAYLARACAHDTLAIENDPGRDSHCAQALADLSAAIRVDPMFSRAYEERGRMYLQLDEEDKGIADLKEAIRLDPANKDAICTLSEHYVRCADALVAADQPEEALGLYKAALDLDPGNDDGGFGYEFFGWRGTAYLRNGQIKQAIKDFIQGIKRVGNMNAVVRPPTDEEDQAGLAQAISDKKKGDTHWAQQEYLEAYEAYVGPEYVEGAIQCEPGLTKPVVENMEATLRVLEDGTDFGTMLDDPITHAAALHAHMQGLKRKTQHLDVKAFKQVMHDYQYDGDHDHHQTMQRIWNSLGFC